MSSPPREPPVATSVDRALASRVAAGDPQARRVFARRLALRVLRIARAMVGDAADADDVAQQAMIAILDGAASYRGESSLERWADRVASRVAIRWLQGRARRDHDGPDPDVLGEAPLEPSWEALPRPIIDYLRALSIAQRSVLVLKYALDHTVEEIAALVGVPVGTVKERLIAGRRELRRLVQRDRNLGIHPRRASDDR